MANKDISLMAHLMRRAGFGAPYDELETRAANGYEATVEELLLRTHKMSIVILALLLLAGCASYSGLSASNRDRLMQLSQA